MTIDDIEQAICDYAAAHPKSIKIASKSGYAEVFLTGPWPDTITLTPTGGDSTVIIIVSENGGQTIINADGTVTTGSNSGSESGGDNNGGSDAGGDGDGGDDNGSGDQ